MGKTLFAQQILAINMQIFVKNLNAESTVYNVTESTSVLDLKNRIFEANGIDTEMLRLVHQGTILENGQILAEMVAHEATVHMSLGLLGGKKGKKKVYKTKKKNKHKHIPEKLATLKYYSIDGNGAITRSRKICPECGPGFFMAKHLDRHYCGRCHLSLKLDPAAIKAAQEALKKKGDTKKKVEEVAAPVEEAKGKKGKKGKK